MRSVTLLSTILALSSSVAGVAEEFPEVYNTRPQHEVVASPREALEKFRTPPGFHVTLPAAEPDVQQPIAMTFDARGRLWVAENYTYAGRPQRFDRNLRDRIIVLEDTTGDGQFDQRKVFWDKGQLLSSVEVGFGGVWALCPPHLLFIPDRDGDDVPDGEPEILLTGFDDDRVVHNLVNGLKWGPDGWLYGRHGILATSRVGPPGSPSQERQALNCGIWRYHPLTKAFEVVAHGTTNPWGMDWDEHGEAFFINVVIGHLWHLIPGAHYRRMFGEDLDPHVYGLIEQHADHFHWDNTIEPWQGARKEMSTSTSGAGGGHAHAGLMIYQADNWPESYRGRLFTLNLHGRRINQDRLERHGSGYIGRHEADEFLSDDTWFRGLELLYGPDGGVYVSDWSDTGECHNDEAIHRTSGRIYKITYGKPEPPKLRDLARMSDADLVRLQLHANEWFVRQARRILQERAATGRDLTAAKQALVELFSSESDVPRKLRVLWALHALGGINQEWLRHQLDHENEHVRVWAVRLLTDHLPLRRNTAALPEPLLRDFLRLARGDSSSLVRLSLASTLQRLPVSQRAELGLPLLERAEDANDHNLPLMLWYGIKPVIEADPMRAVKLAGRTKIPLVRRHIARRLAEDLESQPGPVNALLELAAAAPELQSDVLDGLFEALRGWRSAPKPAAWDRLDEAVPPNSPARGRLRELSALFGVAAALADASKLALDDSADLAARKDAFQTLIENRASDLRAVSEQLLSQQDLAGLAARGLALIDDPAIGRVLADRYWRVAPQHRPEFIAALSSRPAFARILLGRTGSGEGQIPGSHISAFHARQIRSFNDPDLNRLLAEVWGALRESDSERRQLIARLKAQMTQAELQQADLSRGRVIYEMACAACHKLYGAGGQLGPELTGSGRHNLDYILEAIIDPSASVAADYRMSSLTLRDGRILSGIISERTERTLTLNAMTERFTFDRSDIEEIEQFESSIMPEGLLQPFSSQQVRDFIAYLMSSEQVPLAAEWQPLMVMAPPQSQQVALGESVTVSVMVNPDSGPPFTYQWRVNGKDIPQATEPQYVIPSFQAEHVGLYSVVVANDSEKNISPPATLTLQPARLKAIPSKGLVLHLDATMLELENGAPVSLWPDLSGVGNHAIQADETRRPTYVGSVGSAGLTAVRFQGTPLPFLLVEGMGPHAPPNTVFLVWKINQATGGSFQSALDGATASERVQIGYEVGPSRMHALSGGSYPARALRKSVSIPFDDPIVTTVVYDPAGGLLRVNGFLEDQNATGDLPITGFTIGRRTAGDTADTQSLGGDIAELIVYDLRLTDGEIEQVEQYLMDKWLNR